MNTISDINKNCKKVWTNPEILENSNDFFSSKKSILPKFNFAECSVKYYNIVVHKFVALIPGFYCYCVWLLLPCMNAPSTMILLYFINSKNFYNSSFSLSNLITWRTEMRAWNNKKHIKLFHFLHCILIMTTATTKTLFPLLVQALQNYWDMVHYLLPNPVEKNNF